MVVVEMTEVEAQMFVLFRKYEDKIVTLLENRVFDLMNGSAEIHFNRLGQIASIDMHSKVFKRAETAVQPIVLMKKVV